MDYLPYGRHEIGEEEIKAATDVLRNGYLTMGPKTLEFEQKFKEFIGAKNAVAVDSATNGLHIALRALGVKAGDEVITTPYSFVATANSVLYCNAKPVFADIDWKTLNISPTQIKKKITAKTKAILIVHTAGVPCEMDEIKEIAAKKNLPIVEDCAHALPAKWNGRKIGADSDAAVFSFHPVKNMTAAQGGMITTKNSELTEVMKALRVHGVKNDFTKRTGPKGSWHFDMEYLGFKANMTDLQAAIGLEQLKKLNSFEARRKKIADFYDAVFSKNKSITLQATPKKATRAYHLYSIRVDKKLDRDEFIEKLREKGIGAVMHFKPTYLHSYYQSLGYKKGLCPIAEKAYKSEVSLPMFSQMNLEDAQRVVNSVNWALKELC